MSEPAGRAFLPVLRRLDGELAIPVLARIRILRELEYDLEELRNRLRSRGLTDDEARANAQEALVPDDLALEALRRLHAPFYGRMTRHLAGARLRLLERSALAVATMSVLVGETWVLLRAQLLRSPSPFLWPVLALGGLLFAVVLATAFQLWVKPASEASTPRASGILEVSGVTLGLAVLGTILDFNRLAAVLERSPELAEALVPRWLIGDAVLLSVALLLALAGGLIWFLLTQWVTAVQGAHRRVLGVDRANAYDTEAWR